jgi:hypothetical protein
MNQTSASEIVEKLETPAMQIHMASVPVNSVDSPTRISRAQLWQALKIWGRGDARFVPPFVESKIVEESADQIVKDILHYGKSNMADGSPNLQRTSFRGDNLMVTEYLAGPWFMAIAGIEERDNGEICLQLTTVRHKQHADYVSPAELARRARSDKLPPTIEQNVERLIGIIRKLAENNEV